MRRMSKIFLVIGLSGLILELIFLSLSLIIKTDFNRPMDFEENWLISSLFIISIAFLSFIMGIVKSKRRELFRGYYTIINWINK